MKSPFKFSTHPNAPVVISFFTVRGRRKLHNGDPWLCKYTTPESAAGLLATLQRMTSSRTYYIAS